MGFILWVKQNYNEINGCIGFIMSIFFPLMETFGILVQILGGVGGLILLVLSIRHKILQGKLTQMEIDEKKKKHGRKN